MKRKEHDSDPAIWNPVTEKNQKDWYRYCRIMLEWLHPKRDLDPETWVEEVVARAQSLKVDTLAFDFYHGGYAIFEGAVAPKDRHVGKADVLALLDKALHKRGMRLVAMNMGQHCARYTAEEYPTWRMQDAEGKPIPAFTSYIMCLNTPYANFLLQELSGLLTRYTIDGLYIEGLYGSWREKGGCYCEYCCTEFDRTYGHPIPRDENARAADPHYVQFRASTANNFVRNLRKVIQEKSPHTVLLPCNSLYENCFTDLATWGLYADAIELERMWGAWRCDCKLFEIGLSMQLVRAESGRPAMGTVWLGWGVDMDYSPSTAEHYRLNFMEILLYGATPQLHAQTIFEVDSSETDTVREMFALVEKVRPTLLEADLVPYAALVLDWVDFNSVPDHGKGFYQALIENHVPFQVLSKRDLKPETLSRFKVLALPNVTGLSDQQVEAVKGFNAAGGGVVLTYRTGCDRPDGSMHPVLAGLAGIKGPFRIVTNPAGCSGDEISGRVNFYRVKAEHAIGTGTLGRLQSFRGSWTEVEVAGGEVIAEALDYDYSKMHRHHPVFGFYPGRAIAPMIITQEPKGGAGRVVYFAGEFDAASFRVCLPGTLNALAQATVWAAGCRPPLEVECSPNLEIATHYSPTRKAYTIMMVNMTTNVIASNPVVRYVEPLHNITLALPAIGKSVAAVRSLTDGAVTHQVEGDLCVITLKQVREYEALVVELTPSERTLEEQKSDHNGH